MNIVLLASHGIAEFDDVRMFHDLGFGIFAPGGYENPAEPGESLRPALPDVPYHADLAAACRRRREERGEPGEMIDWAKADLPDEVVDWADVVIVHHFPDRWIPSNWDRLKGKRVIWRTCGQSDPRLEEFMSGRNGLEIVRYSPAERRYFEPRGTWAGEDALIRFGKYPDDYGPWVGDGKLVRNTETDTAYRQTVYMRTPFVGNITQRMAERGDATGLSFWLAATEGLPARPAGPGSEQLPGGIGALSYDEMREYLRRCRAYLYTGTTPASYTLGLIEAMLSGVPVVSIGPGAWVGPDELFEGADLLEQNAHLSDNPTTVYWTLRRWLDDADHARAFGEVLRQRAESLFGITVVGAQWRAFLS
jgi:hypothetical protein